MSELERFQKLSGITGDDLLVEYKNGGKIDYITVVTNPTSTNSTKEDCVVTLTPLQLIDWAVGAGDKINELEPCFYYGRAKGAANKDCKARMEKFEAENEELADQDYDNDGSLEVSSEEHAGAVDAAIKAEEGVCPKCGMEDCTCPGHCPKCGKDECECPKVEDEETPKEIMYDKGDYVETGLGKGVIKKVEDCDDGKCKYHVKMDKDCADAEENNCAGDMCVYHELKGHIEDEQGRRVVVKEDLGTHNGSLGSAFDAKVSYVDDQEVDPSDGSVNDEAKEITCPKEVCADMAACKKDCDMRIDYNETEGNHDLANFYRKVRDCCDYLEQCFDEGDRLHYDKAVTEFHSWMSPIQHALPLSLRKFLTYGGQTNRSLKDYFDKAKS